MNTDLPTFLQKYDYAIKDLSAYAEGHGETCIIIASMMVNAFVLVLSDTKIAITVVNRNTCLQTSKFR